MSNGQQTLGVALGEYDIEHYAVSFGCKGHTVKKAGDLVRVFQEAIQAEVSVLINIPDTNFGRIAQNLAF